MAANHETLLKYWASVINEANSSGEKLITWMERNGIDRGRFYYWHKLVKEAGLLVKEDNAEASGNLPSCMPGRVPVVAEIRLSDNNKSDRDENAHFRSQITQLSHKHMGIEPPWLLHSVRLKWFIDKLVWV